MKTARILINTPASQGGIGDLYNFKLAPSLTLVVVLGVNSISENVGPKHLINKKPLLSELKTCCGTNFRNLLLPPWLLPIALDEVITDGHKRAHRD